MLQNSDDGQEQGNGTQLSSLSRGALLGAVLEGYEPYVRSDRTWQRSYKNRVAGTSPPPSPLRVGKSISMEPFVEWASQVLPISSAVRADQA